MREIKRSDSQYVEVEEFKDYEFTNCIAYEFAIRNPEVKTLFGKDGFPVDDSKLYMSYSLPLEEIYTKYHFFEKEDNNTFDTNHEKVESKNMADGHNRRGEFIEKIIETEDYINIVAIDDTTPSLSPHMDKNIFYPKYCRPRMYNHYVDRGAMVFLDFSLPEKDLLAFVQKIKMGYNEQKLLSPHDELIKVLVETKGRSDSILRHKEKLADLLFIYDSKILNYKTRKIQNNIYNYYADKGIETKTMDYKTMKKYERIAKIYIEDKKYLELITGKDFSSLIKLGNN